MSGNARTILSLSWEKKRSLSKQRFENESVASGPPLNCYPKTRHFGGIWGHSNFDKSIISGHFSLKPPVNYFSTILERSYLQKH